MSSRNRRTPKPVAFVVIAMLCLLATPLVDNPATAAPTDGVASDGSFSGSTTVSRTHLNADGTETTVDSRTVTLTVDRTQNLRGRQQLSVKWSGAHPTGGLISDVNSYDARQEEYPFVLLECRGIDSPTAPASQQLTPETCWTTNWSERFQTDYNTGWTPWRLDRYASPGDRTQNVDQPDPLPSACEGTIAESARWVPFVAADGTVYNEGSLGCAGIPPDATNVESSALPTNTTYGVTAADGSGSAKFSVWTTDENASLGCTYQVACSLVAVPIEGISCDIAGASLPDADRAPSDEAPYDEKACRSDGVYAAGQPFQPGRLSAVTDSGALWWSASNWRGRISVPLTFAPPSNLCDVVSSAGRIDVYGSEALGEATTQWAPKFCTDPKLFKFVHVRTAEPEAKSLISDGTIEGAFVSVPPPDGYGLPAVQVPVAATGFAISFEVDGKDGNELDTLRLTPRLIAKLLTQSYPAEPILRDNYPALAHNPYNITVDPEFTALNPDVPASSSNDTAATLLSLSAQSDLIYSLTSYLNADPEARAWLDGTPDPWGMVVNPNYRKIALPLLRWPQLDTTLLPQGYIDAQINPCYSASPEPYLGLIANPVNNLAAAAAAVQYAVSNVVTACPGGVTGDVTTLKMQTLGRQTIGHRFMLALTTLGSVARYNLNAAQLQSTSTATVKTASTKFTDDTGRTFTGPTDAALAAAGRTLKADDSTRTWPINYVTLRKTPAAYPGFVLVYAVVPTAGLPAVDAGRFAQLIGYLDGVGQKRGETNGTLADGYLSLSSQNGLGALAAYSQVAAGAIQRQKGEVPSLFAKPSPPPVVTRTHTNGEGPHVVIGRGGSAGYVQPPQSQPTLTTPPPGAPAAGTAAQSFPNAARAQLPNRLTAATVAARSSVSGAALPVVVGTLFAALCAAGLLRAAPRIRVLSAERAAQARARADRLRSRARGVRR